MLSTQQIETWLNAFPQKTIGVLGDLFLDRYFDLDASLTEPSLETGLDAYQVTGVRSYPGALGTVINNLVALGTGTVWPIAIIGDDGEGYELRQALQALRVVKLEGVIAWDGRRTPTYAKPMLCEVGSAPRELNRLDIKNRTPTPRQAVQRMTELLDEAWPQLDALIVLDQVSEEDCGIVTAEVRAHLRGLARKDAEKFVLADSRERIALFESMAIKPNERELQQASTTGVSYIETASTLAQRNGRPVFLTRSEAGIEIYHPSQWSGSRIVPAYPVKGPIDIVGAGDSCSAGLTCAMTAGANFEEAAAFGNLVASITVQQIGTTGTASPNQIRARWHKVASGK